MCGERISGGRGERLGGWGGGTGGHGSLRDLFNS